jgi:predicted TIM-barrel fold metal-dependent hydrolase
MRPRTLEEGPLRTIHGTWNDAPDAVTLIDAHHHLWDLRRNYYPWLTDHSDENFFLGPYEPLKRDYLPEDYLRDARGHNVLATVHCEAEWDRADQVGETRWLTEINARYGFPNAIVAHAWFHTDDAEEVIAAQATFPLARGIRSKPVTSLSPAERTLGAPGTMQDERWLRGFSLLQKYGLSWDLRVPFWHLAEAAQVARSFPHTPIILNHTGFPWDRSKEGLAGWRRAMETIAREPNVHLKISEFGLRDKPWDYESNRRIVLEAIAIFGIERCVFATNFPVAGLRVDYDILVRSVRRMISHLAPDEQERLFWKNATAFYRLRDAVTLSG